MPDRPDLSQILAVHIRAAGRPNAERERLLEIINTALWPGGGEDRTDPAARRCLAQLGPPSLVVDPPHCRCAAGRCALCN